MREFIECEVFGFRPGRHGCRGFGRESWSPDRHGPHHGHRGHHHGHRGHGHGHHGHGPHDHGHHGHSPHRFGHGGHGFHPYGHFGRRGGPHGPMHFGGHHHGPWSHHGPFEHRFGRWSPEKGCCGKDVDKRKERNNGPCCSRNKDQNKAEESRNDTIFVRRIVVDKAPRCYSV